MTKTAEAYLERLAAPRFAPVGLWSRIHQRLAEARCRLIHRSISHPVNGKYRCWTCLKEYETNW